MEWPDLTKPYVMPGKNFRLVAVTEVLQEAERLARQYEEGGYETQIVRRKRAEMVVYEVWVAKEPEVFMGGMQRMPMDKA